SATRAAPTVGAAVAETRDMGPSLKKPAGTLRLWGPCRASRQGSKGHGVLVPPARHDQRPAGQAGRGRKATAPPARAARAGAPRQPPRRPALLGVEGQLDADPGRVQGGPRLAEVDLPAGRDAIGLVALGELLVPPVALPVDDGDDDPGALVDEVGVDVQRDRV